MKQSILTPAMKGLLTKAVKTAKTGTEAFHAVRAVMAKKMPAEQAKHATRKYLSGE